MALKVELVTPQKRLFSVDAEAVTFTGQSGEMTVLPGHIAMITGMRPGPLAIKTGSGAADIYAVGGGVAQIDNDKVVILVESAEAQSDIDVTRAKRALENAERAMRDQSFYDEKFAETQAALGRAATRVIIGRG